MSYVIMWFPYLYSYEIKYLHDIPKKIPIEIAEALRLAKPLGALFRAMGMVKQVEDLIAFWDVENLLKIVSQ